MKLGALLAWQVPELRSMSGALLVRAWEGGTGFSRNKIYVHLLLLLAASSVLFNLVRLLTASIWLELFILWPVALLLPVNLYFAAVLGGRRPQLRKFIEENWEEFRP